MAPGYLKELALWSQNMLCLESTLHFNWQCEFSEATWTLGFGKGWFFSSTSIHITVWLGVLINKLMYKKLICRILLTCLFTLSEESFHLTTAVDFILTRHSSALPFLFPLRYLVWPGLYPIFPRTAIQLSEHLS